MVHDNIPVTVFFILFKKLLQYWHATHARKQNDYKLSSSHLRVYV